MDIPSGPDSSPGEANSAHADPPFAESPEASVVPYYQETAHPDPEPVETGVPELRGGQPHTSPPRSDSTTSEPGFTICALAGLHAGIVGVFWMLGCFVIAAFWNGRSIWSVPNLFSTIFYGDNAYQDEFLRTTWAGIAFLVVAYAIPGAVWGCWWKSEGKPLLRLFGAFTGLSVYYLWFDFIWPRLDPLIPLYAPVHQLQIAHVVWGAALAASPVYAGRIRAGLAGENRTGK